MGFENFPQPSESQEHYRSYEQMRAYIAEISRGSVFAREKEETGGEHITSPEGERFNIKHITDPNGSIVEKIHAAMVEEFGEEEAEALYWIRESIARKKNDYHVIEDTDGRIVSLSNTQYLEYCPTREAVRMQAVTYVAHVWTSEAQRGRGLIKELYRSFLESAVERAKRAGVDFKGVIGEAVNTVEGMLNKFGRKRLYFEDPDGNVRELPYLCPPVDIDSVTGERREDPMPDHFMIRLADGAQQMRVEELLPMIAAVYEEYIGERTDYESVAAYEKSVQYVHGLLEEFAGQLQSAKNGTVFMLSKEERGKLRETLSAHGKRLIEVET